MNILWGIIAILVLIIIGLFKRIRSEVKLRDCYLDMWRKYEDAYWKCNSQYARSQTEEHRETLALARKLLKANDFFEENKL